jgi:uncharacterized membrane protein
MYCKTQIKSSSKEEISENKKLSFCDKCESNIPLSLKNKTEMREEKAMLDKLVEEIGEVSGSLVQS